MIITILLDERFRRAHENETKNIHSKEKEIALSRHDLIAGTQYAICYDILLSHRIKFINLNFVVRLTIAHSPIRYANLLPLNGYFGMWQTRATICHRSACKYASHMESGQIDGKLVCTTVAKSVLLLKNAKCVIIHLKLNRTSKNELLSSRAHTHTHTAYDRSQMAGKSVKSKRAIETL